MAGKHLFGCVTLSLLVLTPTGQTVALVTSQSLESSLL